MVQSSVVGVDVSIAMLRVYVSCLCIASVIGSPSLSNTPGYRLVSSHSKYLQLNEHKSEALLALPINIFLPAANDILFVEDDLS